MKWQLSAVITEMTGYYQQGGYRQQGGKVRVTNSNTSIMETGYGRNFAHRKWWLWNRNLRCDSGALIRCANVWEVIFAHVYKIKEIAIWGC